ADRQRRLAELEAQIPEDVQRGRAAALGPLNALTREQALRAAGASDDQIAAARTATLGAEAAARLADLDRAHAAWDARLAPTRAPGRLAARRRRAPAPQRGAARAIVQPSGADPGPGARSDLAAAGGSLSALACRSPARLPIDDGAGFVTVIAQWRTSSR